MHRSTSSSGAFYTTLLEVLMGCPVDVAAERYLRGLRCTFCGMGIPEQDGSHVLPFGLRVPCEAVDPEPRRRARTWAERNKTEFCGRGITRRVG
jgi:hypothetical protein